MSECERKVFEALEKVIERLRDRASALLLRNFRDVAEAFVKKLAEACSVSDPDKVIKVVADAVRKEGADLDKLLRFLAELEIVDDPSEIERELMLPIVELWCKMRGVVKDCEIEFAKAVAEHL